MATITTPTDDLLPASIAETPFNDKTADLVLRSEDRMNFYVYKIVLSLASPFFADMFSLPQTQAARPSVPTVDCTEYSQTLDHLLRLCYPVTDPAINELNEVADVLEAAMKYQMEEATAMMRKLLLTFIDTKPLQVFAIACRLQLATEAEVAAKKWRQKCPKNSGITAQGKLHGWNVTSAGASFVPEIASISAGCHFRLLRFVRTGKTTTFLEPDPVSPNAEPTTEATVAVQHPFVFENADITLRSVDGIDFRVHSIIISLASANLIDNTTPSQDVIPVIALPEEGRIIARLLKLCYPMGGSDLGDLNTAHAVLQAAIKYKMTGAIEVAKKQWMEHLKTDPARVYFTAVRNGWKEEAQEAAMCDANQAIEDVYVPDMEFMSATVYHRLLEYHHKYRSALAAITSDHEKTRSEAWTADMSTWWSGGISNKGGQTPVPMLIAAPIVQRELRVLATQFQNNYRNSGSYYHSYNPQPTVPDIRTLIDENIAFEAKLQEALSKIELELELPQVFPLSRHERRYS